MTRMVRFLDDVIGVRSSTRRRGVTFNRGEVAALTDKQLRSIKRMEARSGKQSVVDFKSYLETWWCPLCSKRFVVESREAHNRTFHKELIEIHVCFEQGCGRSFISKTGLAIHQGHAQHGKYSFDDAGTALRDEAEHGGMLS